MRILIACEYSGVIRDAFIAKGHDVMSCDLLETERPGPHYKGDVMDVLYDGWDMMIAHPDCTKLTSAGQWFYSKRQHRPEVEEAVQFFMKLWHAPIHKICIENPAGIMTKRFRKPNQYIDPYFFGEPHRKRTGLWLKNLPRLNGLLEVAANRKQHEPKPLYVDIKSGKNRYFTDSISGVGRGGAF
jgi:hypothetical protein